MRKTNTFGYRFIEAMEAKKLTQGEIAKSLATSKSLVSNWANGKNIPALKNCKKLSKLLNVSIEFLLTGQEVPTIFDGNNDNSDGEGKVMSDTQRQLGYIIENGSESDIEFLMGKIGRIFNDTQLKKDTQTSKKRL